MKAKWTITDDDYEQVKRELRESVNKMLDFYRDIDDTKHYAETLERAYGIEDALTAIMMKSKFEISYDDEEVQK